MLSRLLAFALLVPCLAHADYQGIPPVEIARDPSSMVHDCVNAITGSYCDFGCPLQLAGPSSLKYRHAYCSLDASRGDIAGGWSLNGTMLAYMYAGCVQKIVQKAIGDDFIYYMSFVLALTPFSILGVLRM